MPSKAWAYSGPKLRGASMPASHTVTLAALSLPMIASRLRSAWPGSLPRSASLPPSATQTIPGLSAIIQSTQARPPAAVSPDTP